MLTSAMSILGWKNESKLENTEWMKRYQQLTWMGFPENEVTLRMAKKYQDVQLCIEHLTKDEDEYIQNEDTKPFGIPSIVNSIFSLMSTVETIGSDDEKEEVNKNEKSIESEVLCKCGAKMLWKDTAICYNDTSYLYVICDKCDNKCDDNSKVYHCPRFQIEEHLEGYDICENCAFQSNGKVSEIMDVQSGNKHIEPIQDANEEESHQVVEDDKLKLIKRALIIQTLSNDEHCQCQDAVALSNLFGSLGYQIIVIFPTMATRKSINDALDKLYASDQQQGLQTFTIICYSGHGNIAKDDSFSFFLEIERVSYSSQELYKRINMDVSATLRDGFIRMVTGSNQQNETLLIINACHSGALQKQLKQHENTEKSVSIWRNTKIWVLVFVVTAGVLCYFVSKYDKKCETSQAAKKLTKKLTEELIEQPILSESHPVDDPNQSEAENGMDKSQELMEREMDGSVDIDWNDLKSDFKNRWSKWKGKVSGKTFVEKYCSALLKNAPCDGPDQMVVEPAINEIKPVVDENKMQEFDKNAQTEMKYVPQAVLDNPMSRETWAYLARNMKDCAIEQVMKNVASLVGPVGSLFMSGGILMSSWLRSTKANTINLVASSKDDQQSNFVGDISPFVRYVIDAIQEMEMQNGATFDIEKLYESVSYDASNKVLDAGCTLNDINQHPVIHYTKY